MRFSSLFLPLSLLLSIQFISVLAGIPTANLTGTWKTPEIYSDSDSSCCVPTSIYIETVPSGGWKSTFSYSTSTFQDSYSYKCTSLFGYSGSVNINIFIASNGIYRGAYYKPTYPYQSTTFEFEIAGDNQLYVSMPSSYSSYSACRFAMTTKSSGDPLVGGIIFFALIVIVIACVYIKRAQQKQMKAIAYDNAAFRPSQSNPLDGYGFNPVPGNIYIAPNVQTGFVYPQQYAPQADGQINVKFGVVNQGNPQMTMNMNVNGGGFDPYQQRF